MVLHGSNPPERRLVGLDYILLTLTLVNKKKKKKKPEKYHVLSSKLVFTEKNHNQIFSSQDNFY